MPPGNSGKLIRLSKSCLSNAEKLAVMDVLDREFLGMGAEVMQFERALTDYFGRSAVCVANGTAALQLALQAIDISPGDEVLVPSLTYVASFQAISAVGAKPVACDVRADTLTIDWHDAEKRLTPNTKAIMPVHYTGGVGALDQVNNFANKNGLRVIEDAAHAFGSEFQGKRVGSFGDIVCFSFDGIKNITSGEGGCIVTSDTLVLDRVRDARLLGVVKDTEKRYAGERSWEFDVSTQGWRYHMSNIMAAIGLQQLERFSVMAETRKYLASHYDSLLRKCPHITLIDHDYNSVVPHIYVIRIHNLLDRKSLQLSLEKKGIQTGIHYYPNHKLSFFSDPLADPLPVTEKVFSEIISLPLHADMTKQDVDFVCKELLRLIA